MPCPERSLPRELQYKTSTVRTGIAGISSFERASASASIAKKRSADSARALIISAVSSRAFSMIPSPPQITSSFPSIIRREEISIAAPRPIVGICRCCAQLRCAKGKDFCPAAFQPIETFGQRFRPIDICMLFDPVGKNNQITVKRILGHMSFDIVHGVDIACLHIRKYAGTDRLLSHAAVGSHHPLSLRGAAPVRTHRRKDSNLLAMRL